MSGPGPTASIQGTGSPVAPALARVALLILGLLIGLLIFDRALGWYDSSKDLSQDDLLMRDPELAWTNRPGFTNERVFINSVGLRGPELPAVPPANEIRILGTGPSTTFGAGEGGPDTEHTWAAALERGIAALPGDQGDVKVLNGGVPGYSVTQAARRALHLIPIVKPDLVLVFVGPGSQAMLDVSATRNYVPVDGELVPADIVNDTPAVLLPAAILAHKAVSFSALYKRWRLKATDNGRRSDDIDRFVLSRAPRRPLLEPMLESTWDNLETLAAGCRKAGVELRAILVPEFFMDAEAPWRDHLAKNANMGAPPVGTPRREPIDVLAEKLKAMGIQSWSMFDALNMIGTDHERYCCPDGRHWSADGHEVVATAMLNALQRDGLLDTLRQRRAAKPRTP